MNEKEKTNGEKKMVKRLRMFVKQEDEAFYPDEFGEVDLKLTRIKNGCLTIVYKNGNIAYYPLNSLFSFEVNDEEDE